MRRVGGGRRLEQRKREVERFLNELPRTMHEKFRDLTPIDTGNARSKTDLQNNQIQGNYPYANRLNTGWSRQAPNGMFEPTVEFVRRRLRDL